MRFLSILLLAFAFVSSSHASDMSPAPEHVWLIHVADRQFGFVGFHDGTGIYYGSERLRLLTPFPVVVSVVLIAALLPFAAGVYVSRRRRD
jgi:hypothetical protein